MIINSLWHDSKNSTSLWKEHINTHNKDYLYVKSKYSLLSTGTEKIVSSGSVPINGYHAMRVPYMSGSFSLPIKYGYNLIGQVDGQNHLVHCMHPHQDYCQVTPESVFVLPKNIPAKRATLIGTLETVINAIWDAKISKDDPQKVLVVGGGLIGMTLAFTLKHIWNQEVFLHEINTYRLEVATANNIPVYNKESIGLVFHTSGSNSGLQFAIDQVAKEGRVIEMSWYGDQAVNLNLGDSFHYGRKSIISSQVSNIPPHMKPEWGYKSRKELACKYLDLNLYDHLITHEIPFTKAPLFFDQIRNGLVDYLGCVFKY